jgi:hypothetical protein
MERKTKEEIQLNEGKEGPITPITVYSALSCSFTGFQKLKQ